MDINNECFVQAAKEDAKKFDENKKKLFSHLVENGFLVGLNEPIPDVWTYVGQDGTPDFGEHMMFANLETTVSEETIAKLPKLYKGTDVSDTKEEHKVDSLIEAFGGKDIPKSKAEIECEELKKELARVNQKLLIATERTYTLARVINAQLQVDMETEKLLVNAAKELLKDTGYTVDKAKHESIDSMNTIISRAEF